MTAEAAVDELVELALKCKWPDDFMQKILKNIGEAQKVIVNKGVSKDYRQYIDNYESPETEDEFYQKPAKEIASAASERFKDKELKLSEDSTIAWARLLAGGDIYVWEVVVNKMSEKDSKFKEGSPEWQNFLDKHIEEYFTSFINILHEEGTSVEDCKKFALEEVNRWIDPCFKPTYERAMTKAIEKFNSEGLS
jgi:hypothetical protein